MGNKTLTPYFSKVTLKQAWEGDLEPITQNGMPVKQMELLKGICDNPPATAAAVYDFLAEKDPLFCSIYGTGEQINGEEIFTFPFATGQAIPDSIIEITGPIGTQVSKCHRENLFQHIELVATNLAATDMPESLAVKLAVLHDIGKKYTSATNKVGEICYHGHEKVSAFIVGHWLRHQGYSYKTAQALVAVIYGHMQPATKWNTKYRWRTGEPVDYKNDFYEELLEYYGNVHLADRTMSIIEVLAKCDEGVTTDINQDVLDKFKRGQNLIRA